MLSFAMIEESDSTSEKGKEIDQNDRFSKVEADKIDKFDSSVCKRMFIPSYGLTQKRKGNLTSDSTKRLLDDAISIHSSDDDQKESINGKGLQNSNLAKKELNVKQMCSNHFYKTSPDLLHNQRSSTSRGKQKLMDEKKLQNDGTNEESFREEIFGEQINSQILRKRKRHKIDNCILSTIKALSQEVSMKEKDVLLRACKLMLTCKQSCQENQQ